MTAIVMNFGQSTTFTAEPDDASGNKQALPPGATVAFISNNPAAGTLTPNADGVSAIFHGTSTPGATVSTSITTTLTWNDTAGSHSLTSGADTVSVGYPVSPVVAVKLLNSTPA
jgi:hypothetical protein